MASFSFTGDGDASQMTLGYLPPPVLADHDNDDRTEESTY